MGLMILSVDDNSSDQKLISIAFRALRSETEVRFLENGDEALSFLHKSGPYSQAERPDLLMLDLNLPKVSGSEVIAQVRQDENLRDIPIVLFTGSQTNEEIESVCDEDRTLYVGKPTGVDHFVAAIGAIDEYARGMSELPQKVKEHASKLRRLDAA